MGKIAFVLCLGLMSLAWSGDYDGFEKSLMEESSDATSENSSTDSLMNTFEQSLMTSGDYVDMEPVYKLRETLLENIKRKDTARVSESIRELDALQTKECLPIVGFEKKFIYLDLKMYRSLLSLLKHEYKTMYDTLEVNDGYRIAEDDGLQVYIKSGLMKLDTSMNLYNQHAVSIKTARISEEEKDELEILMQLHESYWNDLNLNKMRALIERFVKRYPNNKDVSWFKNVVLLPMQRMDTFSMYMEDRVKNLDRVIESKYYSGGLGFNLYLLGGGVVVSGYDDVYRSDLLEGNTIPVQLEFYLQLKRVAFSLGFFNAGLKGIVTDDLTVGYVVYDSRHIKIRPFLGLSIPFTNFKIKDDFCLGTESNEGSGDYYIKGNELDDNLFDNLLESVPGWVLGANVDFKFATTYLFASDSKLTSFAVAGRFGLSSIDLNGEVVKGSGYSLFFSLGLGIYFW